MKTQSAAAIQAWLVSQLSEVLYVEPEEIDVREPFAYYGLSSSHAAIISGDLENWLGRTLSPTALYEHPTIEDLSRFLSGEETTLRAETSSPEVVLGREPENEPIAIVGIGCRVPGANGVEAFWKLLRNGVDAISEVPADRWDMREFYDPEPTTPGKMNTRWGGFLDRVDQFDPYLFGISPREAERMDPQQRLLMEVAWEALEDAGIAPAELRNSHTGVFVGISSSDYCHLQLSDAKLVDAYAGTGNSFSIAANRLSYFFDLHGPSVTIDSACSSGLVAAHLACQSLRNGESTMALVGASNVMISPEYTIIFAKAGLLAPDGRCKVFDARANGYVRGEGAGLVVLKPLSRAIADGDHVYACILGSAVNQDGRTNGLTAPSRQAQEAMLVEAYARAGVSPGQVQYVEAHGTGTELGDPIEAKALGAILARDRRSDQPCAVGSVKSNIGHLEAAAGIAGLIKVALSLKHKEIPPSLHFEEPNPHIPFRELPLRVQQRLEPWPAASGAALAGVSAFGFGGTNAHVVLTEAPLKTITSESRPWQFLTLSAKTESALEKATENLARHLGEHPGLNLADVAYTLQKGRNSFNHRRVVVCRNTGDAVTKLKALAPSSVFTNTEEPKSRPITFMLSGVGDHYEGMARGLYQSEKVFKEEVDRCCELLLPLLGTDLRELICSESQQQAGTNASGANQRLRQMLARAEQTNSTTSALHQTRLAQPAVFVIEYALAQLLQHWGIRPQQLIGYSLGEYVAACLSGIFSLEDALQVVARRAALIEEVGAGAMLAVTLSEAELQPQLSEGLSISIINGEKMSVVGGTVAAIAELEQRLRAQEIASRRLPTAHAFHTPMMAALSASFAEVLAGVKLNAPQIPVLSNVTGELLTEAEARDPQYWVRHMCETVRFADGLAQILKEETAVVVEVGCGQSLSSFVKQHGKYGESNERVVVSTLRHEWEQVSDEEVLSTALGKLWLSGIELEWERYYEGEERHRVRLPTYPFERQRYWIESKPRALAGPKRPQSQDDLERIPKLDDWFYVPVWKQSVPLVLTESEQEEGAVWMVMTDGSSLASKLIEQLAVDSATVISVGVSEQFDKIDECSYAINPRKRGDYDLLFKALEEESKTPNRIIHLWNVASYEDASSAIELTQETLDFGFYALMFLTQTLGDMGVDETRIIIVSSEMQKVIGDEDLCPAKATLLGPSIVIPCEYTNITCRGVDIVVPRPDSDQEEELVQQLVTEFRHQCKDIIIAYRGEKRWEQTFDPLPLVPLTTPPTVPPPRIRTNGTYLITGGVGGIGLAIAEHLARTAQANLVLISRSGLPERDRWQQLVADEQTPNSLAQKIAQVQALEEMGAEVLVLSADVGDVEQMRDAVRRTEERFGPVDGVIHAAGVPGAGLIQLKTEEVAASVLRPKVQGTLVLDEIFRDRALDFLLLFSSMTSIVGGGPGQLDYCAANAFLDAFAQKNNSRQRPVFAINWGEWQWDAWQEGLLGFDAKIAAVFKENRRRFGVSFEEGLEAIRRVLATRLPQVVVSTRDFKWLIELSKEFTVSGILSEADKKGAPGQAYPRPALGTSYVAPSTEVEHTIAAIWQELLRIEQVGINDNFFELGGNSLLGITLVGQMKKRLKVEMPMYALYEAPTVSAMSKFIDKDNKEDQSLDERRDRGEMRRKRQQQRRTDTRGELAIR